MLAVLRIIGTLNAAVWLGSALFFTFGIAPGVFSDEMKRVFGDYYTGVVAQNLIGRYFAVSLICGIIAVAHFLAETIYAGKPFRRLQFALIALVLALGLLGSQLFAPRIKALHHAKYLGPTDQREAAGKQMARLHAVSMTGNLLSLIALLVYTWRVTNPPDPTRFVMAQKFRG